jgi:HPt (histidine-containing phosphotransfer) domain-containing protein
MMEENNDNLIFDIEAVSAQLRIRPDIYLKIVASFSESLTGKMQHLNDALAQDDRDQMRMILHEIKGTAGNLRLHTITGPETALHMAVKAGENQKALAQHFSALLSAVQELQQYVVKLISEKE